MGSTRKAPEMSTREKAERATLRASIAKDDVRRSFYRYSNPEGPVYIRKVHAEWKDIPTNADKVDILPSRRHHVKPA